MPIKVDWRWLSCARSGPLLGLRVASGCRTGPLALTARLARKGRTMSTSTFTDLGGLALMVLMWMAARSGLKARRREEAARTRGDGEGFPQKELPDGSHGEQERAFGNSATLLTISRVRPQDVPDHRLCTGPAVERWTQIVSGCPRSTGSVCRGHQVPELVDSPSQLKR